ncbi:MAG: nitroreductase [Marinosulfonomonas sp.]|nr:nitroreductase [Marinosulfonomonas sp.]
MKADKLHKTSESKGRGAVQDIVGAISSRRSIRAFLPDQVPQKQIEEILSIASRAPSGTNTQPWKVYVVSGDARLALSQEILTAFMNDEDHQFEFKYYPDEIGEPYLARRRANGWGLYGTIGIVKGDRAKMKVQHGRNYKFFDAPTGLIFTIDRHLEIGSWFDYGMFLQSIMLVARSFGLDTCPQQAFAQYHKIIQRRLSIPKDEMVVCGMALGYADMAAPENSYVTDREPVAGFAKFVDELAQ